MTKKTRADEEEEEEEGEEIYNDVIGEERRTEENLGIEENRNIRKKVERSDNVLNLEFSGLMKPIVNYENLAREGSGNTKEKITKNDIGTKFELPRMRNSAERDIRVSLALSKLIDIDLQGGEDGEGGRTSHASMESWRRRTKGGRGLAEDAVETLISQASTSASSEDEVTRRTVKGDKGQAGHHRGYKYYAWTVLTLVFKLTLRMQTWVQILITAFILSMVSSAPTLKNKEKRPSKYKVQPFDCGVPGKIQILQIPEKCSKDSNNGGTGRLRRTYVLSPRKLKRTFGVSCCATVSEFRGYCGMYSHWKFQQTPVIEKCVSVTPEVCNQAWREGIVTLPDITN